MEPRLKTIEMVNQTIKDHNREYSIYQLWRNLPKKIMYQTFKIVIDLLIKNNEIVIDSNKKIVYIHKQDKILTKVNREEILSNLSYYGYDLISTKIIRHSRAIPIEELIVSILIKYPEARFIESIPILLIKNKINKFKLYRLAYDFNLINKIGFLLEIAIKISKKINKEIHDIEELYLQFKKDKIKQLDYLTNLKNKKFLDKNTASVMKKWNLRGLFSFNDFYKEVYLW